MAPRRLLRLLHRSGYEFWLPLPLIGMGFWGIGNLISAQVLSRSTNSIHNLRIDSLLEVKVSETIVAINAEIDRDRNFTLVQVTTAKPTAQTIEYQFAGTITAQVEQALAEELGISVTQVRKLVSYRIKD